MGFIYLKRQKKSSISFTPFISEVVQKLLRVSIENK